MVIAGARTARTSTTASLYRRRSCSSDGHWPRRSLFCRRARRCSTNASRWPRRSSRSRWIWRSRSIWCAGPRGGCPRAASTVRAQSTLPPFCTSFHSSRISPSISSSSFAARQPPSCSNTPTARTHSLICIRCRRASADLAATHRHSPTCRAACLRCGAPWTAPSTSSAATTLTFGRFSGCAAASLHRTMHAVRSSHSRSLPLWTAACRHSRVCSRAACCLTRTRAGVSWRKLLSTTRAARWGPTAPHPPCTSASSAACSTRPACVSSIWARDQLSRPRWAGSCTTTATPCGSRTCLPRPGRNSGGRRARARSRCALS
mmetsp:Transcript_5735/g.18461  ORF Transcript_5735/g.18461 Transcript_5735/m.18461 type:complete len:318 (-) Transcript_5735:918-1871(-)